MSVFINIVHKCVTPEVLPEYGDDTIWECDCKQKWVLTSFTGYWGGVRPERGFYQLQLHKWNDKENRLKTHQELEIETQEWRIRHLDNQTKFIERAKKNRWKLPFFNN